MILTKISPLLNLISFHKMKRAVLQPPADRLSQSQLYPYEYNTWLYTLELY